MNLCEAVRIARREPDAAGSRAYLKRDSWNRETYLVWSDVKNGFIAADRHT